MKKKLIILSVILVGSLALISMVEKELVQEPWEVPSKYQKMKNPYLNTVDTDKIGRILYTKRCKSCHGVKGKGDGKKAETLDTEVGDFTDQSFKDQTDGTLYYKTLFGRDDMPSFKKKITDEKDRWLLINYIKSF
ncbi:c-type cytochrome [Lutibacter sp.]